MNTPIHLTRDITLNTPLNSCPKDCVHAYIIANVLLATIGRSPSSVWLTNKLAARQSLPAGLLHNTHLMEQPDR